AVAKIAAIELCRAFRAQHGARFVSAMPTNLYGPGDRFDLARSHVVPALILKLHQAKLEGRREVIVWGTGRPRRELLYVDDCAAACVLLMDRYDGDELVHIGAGEDATIREL